MLSASRSLIWGYKRVFKLKSVPLGYTARRITDLHVCGWKFGYYQVSRPRPVNFAGAVIQRCLFNQIFAPRFMLLSVPLMRFYARPYRDGSYKTAEDAIIRIATKRMSRELRVLRSSNCLTHSDARESDKRLQTSLQTKLSSEAFLLVYLDEFRFLHQNILQSFQPSHETFLTL